ncbi:butyrophilin subfamily 3 member A1-like [Megalobrama amblycephala]|uniref:butyrophilin subfamily 3 member A1-like n=1 Tax=Megalobrama amblycephala TaxID=75352 RepID=UPI002013E77F|nr:butyrophilin subfamily 3 member A1-like [Megalobrama amblycephala]
MNRANYTLPDAVALIDVPKYLGNLKYQVWKKMKDVCLYYPVILNPHTSSPNVVSVSDDLTSVTSSRPQPKALPLHRNRVVLGSVEYANGVHSWDIEVGNSRHWTLGVCLGSVERSVVQPLTPENGFWGLRRDGDSYILMDTGMSRLNMKRNPEVVRVKIDYFPFDHNDLFLIFQNQKHWRKVSFSDARSDSFLAGFTRVPVEKELFPFVIPEDQSVPLRVVPAKVIVTVEQKLSFTERVLILILGVFVVVIVIILS